MRSPHFHNSTSISPPDLSGFLDKRLQYFPLPALLVGLVAPQTSAVCVPRSGQELLLAAFCCQSLADQWSVIPIWVISSPGAQPGIDQFFFKRSLIVLSRFDIFVKGSIVCYSVRVSRDVHWSQPRNRTGITRIG